MSNVSLDQTYEWEVLCLPNVRVINRNKDHPSQVKLSYTQIMGNQPTCRECSQ